MEFAKSTQELVDPNYTYDQLVRFMEAQETIYNRKHPQRPPGRAPMNLFGKGRRGGRGGRSPTSNWYGNRNYNAFNSPNNRGFRPYTQQYNPQNQFGNQRYQNFGRTQNPYQGRGYQPYPDRNQSYMYQQGQGHGRGRSFGPQRPPVAQNAPQRGGRGQGGMYFNDTSARANNQIQEYQPEMYFNEDGTYDSHAEHYNVNEAYLHSAARRDYEGANLFHEEEYYEPSSYDMIEYQEDWTEDQES